MVPGLVHGSHLVGWMGGKKNEESCRERSEKQQKRRESSWRRSPQTEPLPPNKTKSFPLLYMSSHHSLLRCGLRKWPPKCPQKGGLGQGERLGEVKTCKMGGGEYPSGGVRTGERGGGGGGQTATHNAHWPFGHCAIGRCMPRHVGGRHAGSSVAWDGQPGPSEVALAHNPTEV